MPPSGQRTTTAALAALTAAGVLWGTTFLLGKIVLREVGVGHMVLYRFWFVGLALIPILVRRRVPIPRREWPTWLLASFLGVPLQFLLQYAGLARTSVSHAALMVGTVPVMIGAAAVLFVGERMRARGWVAVLVSAAGVAVIVAGAGARGRSRIGDPNAPSVIGDALVVAGLMSATAWVLMAKRLMRRYSSVTVTAYVLGIGTVMTTVWVLAVDGRPPTSLSAGVWAALALLGVAGTVVPTVLWNWGLSRVPASRAGIFVNLEPLIGCALGITVLHDPLSALTMLGGLMIVGSAVAVTLEG